MAPAKPDKKSYDKLISALSAHFNSLPLPVVRRFKFNTQCQQPGESVAVFVTQLRSLSEDCQFGDSLLEDMLRDWLVCGINNDSIQKPLLAESDLRFAKAVQLAQSMETTDRKVQELQKPSTVSGTPSSPCGVHEVHKASQYRRE